MWMTSFAEVEEDEVRTSTWMSPTDLDTADHIQDLSSFGTHSQCICWEPGDRVREARDLFHERVQPPQSFSIIVHRKCSVAFRETVFYELPCLRGLQTFVVTVWPSSSYLNSAQAEQFKRCFPQYVRTSMPGCGRCYLRLNAPFQGLEGSFKRYRNSPAMHDAFPAQYMPPLFHGRVLVIFSTPTKCIRFSTLRGFNLSLSKRRCQDQEQNPAWCVACGVLFL